jgi:hypothetical protein
MPELRLPKGWQMYAMLPATKRTITGLHCALSPTFSGGQVVTYRATTPARRSKTVVPPFGATERWRWWGTLETGWGLAARSCRLRLPTPAHNIAVHYTVSHGNRIFCASVPWVHGILEYIQHIFMTQKTKIWTLPPFWHEVWRLQSAGIWRCAER